MSATLATIKFNLNGKPCTVQAPPLKRLLMCFAKTCT